jgi:hypothetical protein
MHVTKMDVTKALELQASMDSGFKGYFTEEGGGSDKRQRRSLSIHFMFLGPNGLEGSYVCTEQGFIMLCFKS